MVIEDIASCRESPSSKKKKQDGGQSTSEKDVVQENILARGLVISPMMKKKQTTTWSSLEGRRVFSLEGMDISGMRKGRAFSSWDTL